MALTVTFDLATTPDNIVGNKRNRHITIGFDNQYAIGGEALTAAMCGLVVLERVIFDGPAVFVDTPDFALTPYWSKTDAKLQLFWADDAAADDEVPDTTDVSAFTLRAIAVGY